MEGAPPKPKGRRRLTKKHDAAGDAAMAAAAAAGHAARPATTAATEATEHTQAGNAAHQPKPSLSQQLARSLKRLSQLGPGSKAEEGEEVDQQLLRGGQVAEPASPAAAGDAANGGMMRQAVAMEENDEARSRGEEEEEEGRGSRLAGVLAALRRRAVGLAQLRSGAAAGRFVPAALALLLLATLGGGLLAARRQARAHEAELADLRAQLTGQRQVASADGARLRGQLTELDSMVKLLTSRTAASSIAVQELRQSCRAHAENATSLHAELAAMQEAVTRLQLAAAAAATNASSTSPTVDAELAAAAAAAFRERMREVARHEASAALALFAADRTGLPDFALASIGGAVVAHSPAHMPPQVAGVAGQGRAGSLYGRLHGGASSGVHPQANRLLLVPVAQPGACLPLVGGSGWVDIRLAQPLRPSAFTYEHIPAAIAHDIRSAPRNLTLLGFRGRPPAPPAFTPAGTAATSGSAGSGAATGGGSASDSCAGCSPGGGGGVLLGEFAYDAHAVHAVQTFQLTAVPPGLFVDHVRLLVGSNHGHPGYTCLYRIRVHGTPAAAVAA